MPLMDFAFRVRVPFFVTSAVQIEPDFSSGSSAPSIVAVSDFSGTRESTLISIEAVW